MKNWLMKSAFSIVALGWVIYFLQGTVNADACALSCNNVTCFMSSDGDCCAWQASQGGCMNNTSAHQSVTFKTVPNGQNYYSVNPNACTADCPTNPSTAIGCGDFNNDGAQSASKQQCTNGSGSAC